MENGKPTRSVRPPKPEITDLERRVLAHERILKSLIAYMSLSEPHVLDHLMQRFVVPMEKSRREQNYTVTDDYAEQFIRAVVALGKMQAVRATSPECLGSMRKADQFSIGIELVPQPRSAADRVEARQRNGIWRVTADGEFLGDYHTREAADAHAALARRSLD
jgi:hypothetical protein